MDCNFYQRKYSNSKRQVLYLREERNVVYNTTYKIMDGLFDSHKGY